MSSTAIVYPNFFDPNGSERKLGGVETYLWQLSRLISDRGGEPVLFQAAERSFRRQLEHLAIEGIVPSRRLGRTTLQRDLYERAVDHVQVDNGTIVFGADHTSVPTRYPRAVSIQHGIGWDLPAHFYRQAASRVPLPDGARKRYVAWRSRRYFENCPNRVCVDYNFPNWYRAQSSGADSGRIWTIPNFVDLPRDFAPDLGRHRDGVVRFIFARRFVEYRGTRIMTDAARSLLDRLGNVSFCFAGEGPDEAHIRERFGDDPRVSITRFLPEESLAFHSQFHVAVVPSLASEGTSLSLAEAMGAGCAVVATGIGGMTNMVIDGYNGRLVQPQAEALADVLHQLATDPAQRARLATRAADTAREAFSLDRWRDRWSHVFDEIERQPPSNVSAT